MATTTVHDRRIDAVLTVVCVVVLGAVLEQQTVHGSLPPWWVPVDVALGAASIVALWWRRRWPVAVGLVTGVVGGLAVTATLPVLIALWTVATMRRLPVAAAVGAAHLAVGIPYVLVIPVYDGPLLAWALILGLLYAVIVTAGAAVRARRQVTDGLVQAARRDRDAHEARAEAMRGQERARIAREMHDVLAHRISLLSMHAGALEYRTQPGGAGGDRLSDAELHESVAVIRDCAHRALEELREVLTVLRDGSGAGDAEPPQPVLADLPRLLDEARRAGQRVELRGDTGPDRLAAVSPAVQRTAYRTVQEGLTNARKHAPGARVDVALTVDRGRSVRVELANPLPVGVTAGELRAGAGIPGSGAGLTGLAERARIDGGELRTRVRDGAFVLEVELPWRT